MELSFGEYLKIIVSAFLTIGSVVASAALIVTNTVRYKDWKMRRRLETCPNRQLAIHSLGGQILLVCDRAIYKSYISDKQRDWLIEAFEVYAKAGGNGVVKYYYEQAMALPPEPDEER